MILCCGEALIDMIPTPTIAGPDGFVPHSGGAVFNTAIALGRLGIKTGMLSGISTDMFGQQLLDGLTASNVSTEHVISADRPTTLAFVKLTNGHASYTFMDENSAGRMLTPTDMPQAPAGVTAMFFGGISLACEPCADAYAALMARSADSRVIMMDPNIRIGFIEDIARYRHRLSGMISQTDIIKVSDEDLDWIVEGDMPLSEKVQTLLENGPRILILTKGGDGATAYMANGTQISVPAQIVEVADTVGAGDTFNAGVLAKLTDLGVLNKDDIATLDPDTMKLALRYGAQVAAITVSRAGANPPWAHEF